MSDLGEPARVEPCDVLFIVYKATSELDFGLPLLWKLRQERPDLRIAVFYCALDRRGILRKSDFYSRWFEELGIPEYDFSDFVRFRLPVVRSVARLLDRQSKWDDPLIPPWIEKRLASVIERLEPRPIDSVPAQEVLDAFRPRVVFYALRGFWFPQKKELEAILRGSGVPVFLYPHGGFNSNGFQVVSPELIPKGWELWLPMREEQTPALHPEIAERLVWCGYSGLDSAWLEAVQARAAPRPPEPLRCLFLIRTFREPASYGRLSRQEFERLLREIVTGLRQLDRPVKLVVKPHPSNNYDAVEQLLRESGHPDWEISYDAVYEETARADFAITVPSTSMLTPLLAGVPVLLLECSFARHMRAAWAFNEELLGGVPFRAETPDAIPARIAEVVATLDDPQALAEVRERTRARYRQIYPDTSLDQCLARIAPHLPREAPARA